MTSNRKPQAFVLVEGRRKPTIEFVAEPVEKPLVTVPSTESARGRRRRFRCSRRSRRSSSCGPVLPSPS
jgi:hypothetical protein